MLVRNGIWRKFPGELDIGYWMLDAGYEIQDM